MSSIRTASPIGIRGLIDTHVHLVCDGADGALDRAAGYSETEIERVLKDSLSRQLAAGVTTVRDLGARRLALVRPELPQ